MFLIKTAAVFLYVVYLIWLSLTIGFSPTLHAAASPESLMITWVIFAFGPGLVFWVAIALRKWSWQTCVHCLEQVKPGAKVCKHCGLDPTREAPVLKDDQDPLTALATNLSNLTKSSGYRQATTGEKESA